MPVLFLALGLNGLVIFGCSPIISTAATSKDIAHLTWDNVDFREGMVRFVRKKTERANKGHQVKISAVLSPIAEEVIKNYGIPSKG